MATQMSVVDYHSLSRRELQNLCKKHGIPANKTNAYMAEALTSIFKVSQQNRLDSETPKAKSIPSKRKRANEMGVFLGSEVVEGKTFCSSEGTKLMDEDTTPAIQDTYTEKHVEENNNQTSDDATKPCKVEQILQHVESSIVHGHNICQQANQQNEFGSETAIALCQDTTIKSVPSKMEKHNKSDDLKITEVAKANSFSSSETREGTELMVEDVVPALKDTYNDEFSEKASQAEMTTSDKTTETSKAPQFTQVGSPILDDQKELHRQEKVVNRKDDNDSLFFTCNSSPGEKSNKRDNYEAKIYTVNEDKAVHVGVDHLDQNKVVHKKGDVDLLVCTPSPSCCKEENEKERCETKVHTGCEEGPIHIQGMKYLGQEDLGQQDKHVTRKAEECSVLCISSSFPFKETNENHNHEAKTYTIHENRPIHIECLNHLDQNKEIYTKYQEGIIVANEMRNKLGNSSADPVLLVSNEKMLGKCYNNCPEKENQNDNDIDHRKGLFAMEIDTVNEKVQKNLVQNHTTDISDKSSGTAFQFSVECDNGIKLLVDLKNSSPSDWMKNHNYEFSLPEDFREHRVNGHSQSTTGNSPSIHEGDTILAVRKTEPAKLPGLRPLVSDFHKSSNPNPTSCSFNFLNTQNFRESRESRRTSSVLIPPHGANRGLSPLIAQKSRRFSSIFISPQNANNLSSPSVIGNAQKSVTQEVHQINCLSESTQPVMTASSKAVETLSIHSGALEKQMLPAKNHHDNKAAYSIHGSADNSHASEVEAVITPIKDGCEDVEMLDQVLHYSSTKSPKNETDKEQQLQLQEEDHHNSQKEDESISQMHCIQKSQKAMHYKSLMLHSQSEETRTMSRYKDDYKKSPFTKNLQTMKNLARVSNMRADILARRRGMPLVENNSAYSQSSSVIHNVPHLSQNVSEKQFVHVSGVRGEIVNEDVTSSHAYYERDLCGYAVKSSERENSVLSLRVLQNRDLSVSRLTPGKGPLQNICNIPAPSALLGPVMARDSSVSGIDKETHRDSKVSKSNLNLSGRPFQAFARKRFLEKALAESTEKMKAQKMHQNVVNDCLSAQKQFAEKFNDNADVGYENQNNNTVGYLLDLNLANTNALATEDEYNKRVTESQKKHQKQFKTPLGGRSKEKAIKIAKTMALIQRNEILKSKRGITPTN